MAVSAVTTVVFWSYESGNEAVAANAGLPLKELRLFSNIYGRVKHNYVDPVEDEQLIRGAIDGMLATLDPYSVYLKEEPYKNLKIGTTGKFGGLGIVVDMEDELVKVVSPIDDTPASRAGIQTGDLIFKIDGKNVRGMKLSEAVKLMRGIIGTKVKLTILRDGETDPLEMELTRAEIKVTSTRETLLEPGYGYVRISRFQTNTSTDLKGSMDKLAKQNKQGLQGLILDLRNNPGGVLTAAVQVLDIFLEQGQMVVYTKGRRSDSSVEYKTSAPDRLNGLPVIVLINKGSASASEITAGALKDTGRAIIAGKQSYGKGSVQTIHPLEEKAALKLTTAKYYTPSGQVIDGVGVAPDIELEFAELTDEQVEERKKLNTHQNLKEWLAYDSQVRDALAKLKSVAMSGDGQKAVQ